MIVQRAHFFAPAGAKGCSHGWSAVAAGDEAQPVVPFVSAHSAPEGAEVGFAFDSPSAPAGAATSCPRSTGSARSPLATSLHPWLQTSAPFGAETERRLSSLANLLTLALPAASAGADADESQFHVFNSSQRPPINVFTGLSFRR